MEFVSFWSGNMIALVAVHDVHWSGTTRSTAIHNWGRYNDDRSCIAPRIYGVPEQAWFFFFFLLQTDVGVPMKFTWFRFFLFAFLLISSFFLIFRVICIILSFLWSVYDWKSRSSSCCFIWNWICSFILQIALTWLMDFGSSVFTGRNQTWVQMVVEHLLLVLVIRIMRSDAPCKFPNEVLVGFLSKRWREFLVVQWIIS